MKALNLGADGYFSKIGHPETVYGELAHGISQAVETKKTEQKLAFQAHLLSSVHDALTATDENFIFTYWNQIAEKMFGWTAKEAIGQSSKELLQAKFPCSSRTEAIDKLLKDGFYSGEVYYSRKDGTYVLTDVHSTAVRSPQGKFKGTVASFRDITERRKAEKEIENLARFPSENPSPILRIAKDDTILYANAAAKSMLGELKIESGQPAPHQ